MIFTPQFHYYHLIGNQISVIKFNCGIYKMRASRRSAFTFDVSRKEEKKEKERIAALQPVAAATLLWERQETRGMFAIACARCGKRWPCHERTVCPVFETKSSSNPGRVRSIGGTATERTAARTYIHTSGPSSFRVTCDARTHVRS